MNISEDQFIRWAKAPSETEEGKCQAAVRQVTDAIHNRFGDSVSVFLQGSYKNRTNVRLDSDVDIVVRHNGFFYPDIDSLSESEQQLYRTNETKGNYTFAQFKAEVHTTLQLVFGTAAAQRKDKCILVSGNSQRVDADVVPCFVHKRFASPTRVSAEGIELYSDKGLRIFSFPEQHYANGVAKNNATSHKYKSCVRILKNIRNELIDKRVITDKQMPSFFLECLVWNVLPDSLFNTPSFSGATRNVVATVWNDMGDANKAQGYAEVSNLLWLFHGLRTHSQAREFMQQVWDYVGYAN